VTETLESQIKEGIDMLERSANDEALGLVELQERVKCWCYYISKQMAESVAFNQPSEHEWKRRIRRIKNRIAERKQRNKAEHRERDHSLVLFMSDDEYDRLRLATKGETIREQWPLVRS